MRVREIRTLSHNLLVCKIIQTQQGEVVLEVKNGKRTEQLPLDRFLAEINCFTQECAL